MSPVSDYGELNDGEKLRFGLTYANLFSDDGDCSNVEARWKRLLLSKLPLNLRSSARLSRVGHEFYPHRSTDNMSEDDESSVSI